MISQEFDLGKARVMLYYLSRSKKSIEERDLARKKLDIKLRQLKKISTESIQKHLEELEGHIHDTINKERGIAKAQADEEMTHKKISDKIEALEGKLSRYLQTKEAREKRIIRLEQKIRGKIESKHEKTEEIAKRVKQIEKIYSQARKNKKIPQARLKAIKKKLDILNEKLKSMQK